MAKILELSHLNPREAYCIAAAMIGSIIALVIAISWLLWYDRRDAKRILEDSKKFNREYYGKKTKG